MNKPIEKHIQRIGRHMVEFLAQNLQSGAMPLARAKEIASFYLEFISVASDESVLQTTMNQVQKKFPELEPIVRSEKLWRNRPVEDQR